MRHYKYRSHVLFPIILFSLLALALLTFSRVGLTLWQNAHIQSASDWYFIIVQGIRVDVATLCWLYGVPALLLTLLPTRGILGKTWLLLLRLWLVIGLWIMVYMELATPGFIDEYNLRPNRLFIEYLEHPKEVFSMLWGGYKLELFVGLFGSLITLILGWKLSRVVTQLRSPKWYWRPVMGIVVVALAVMGGRSTLQHRALNPALVAFSTDPLLNDLVLNSSYSLVFAAKNMVAEKNAEDFYGSMPLKQAVAIVKRYSGKSERFLPGNIPTLNTQPPRYHHRKNLVILLQESLGARLVGGLGGLPLTPHLDQLLKQGWNFTRLYATGTRSVRGIEAVITGFPPTPSRAVVKLGLSQTGFFTIAQLLKRQGYVTQFIYGGESHFDNMKSFFLGNGFTNIVDLPQFSHPKFVGSWGASDQDLYTMSDRQFTRLSAQGKPFFSLVFTTSNHSPYEFPDGAIDLYEQPKQTRNNAVKYADQALGEFIEKAKKSNYWHDTVFIVIADHDSRAKGHVPVPVDRFHIPAVIFGEGITAREDDRLASNIDIPPTLLSLMGVWATTPMIGHDMTQAVRRVDQRALMQFDKNFGYLTNDKLVVLQPQKAPIGYHYDFAHQTLTLQPLSKTDINRALAHAVIGGKLYRQQLYHLPAQ